MAIKVLAPEIAGDPAARSRFEREARAVAALDHPHICGIHDVGEANGTHYLVMPLIEGQTLAARLEKGQLPLDQALTIGTQIADALDKAHRQGIVHRDLKPANIMLTKAGAKLLDFGLAKLRAPGGPIALSGMERLATTSPGTAQGTILGTVQYMAPEQVEGREADARADIWALGAVIYEMITGARPFPGDTPASVIGAILKDTPPPVSQRQPLCPESLDRLVARCLEKDPEERWQAARDVLSELRWVATTRARGSAVASVPRGTRRPFLGRALAAVAAAAATALGVTAWGSDPVTPARDVRFSVYPEPGSAFSPASASVVAPQFTLSHDGTSLAFVANSDGRDRLWVRRLDTLDARVLPGTDDAVQPFWSPDGRSLGFFAQGKLKVVSLEGGTAVVVTDVSFDPRGGAWATDGTILISPVSNGGLSRVSADSRVERVAALDIGHGETALRWPTSLPGSHFLAVARNIEDARRGIYLGSLADESRSLLVHSDWKAAFADGWLLFLRGSTLMAQALDLGHDRLTGDPVALLDRVGATTNGYSAFSVSTTGTLAYSPPWPNQGELVWFDRAGRQIGDPVAPSADYVDVALSPDATRVAMSRVDPVSNNADIWLLDLARRDRAEPRLTTDRLNDAAPLWSPDASRIYFRSNRRGVNSLYVKSVESSREEELVFEQGGEPASSMIPSSLSRDGSRLLFSTFGLRSSFDVWELSIARVPTATPVLQGRFNEYQATFSPDGRWIAFVSNENGPPQVFVQSYPGGEPRRQVSSRGGSDPQWRADGGELFFLGADRALMAAPVPKGSPPGEPQLLFRTRVPMSGNPYRTPYAVAPDGQRFLVNTAPADTAPPAIHVVLDWHALLPADRR